MDGKELQTDPIVLILTAPSTYGPADLPETPNVAFHFGSFRAGSKVGGMAQQIQVTT